MTGKVESQGKLARSRYTFIHSFSLSLSALFSFSLNTETLNLHTEIHQGPRVCMTSLWDDHNKITHWQVHTLAGIKDRNACKLRYLLVLEQHTHTHKHPPQGFGGPM